jgi:hypothetical protein
MRSAQAYVEPVGSRPPLAGMRANFDRLQCGTAEPQRKRSREIGPRNDFAGNDSAGNAFHKILSRKMIPKLHSLHAFFM